MMHPSATSDVDHYTGRERAAIIISCMLGFALDLYDVLIMPYLMGPVQATLGISLTQASSMTSVTMIGSVVGGALFGWLGDRMGRKRSLLFTLALFALGSIASAFAWDYWSLASLRFVTGIGLGGEWGAGIVLFNEAWNKDRRGLGSAFIQGSAVIAAAAAGVVGVWATTSFSQEWGWRIALLTGGSPIILMIFVRLFMPESKAWQSFDAARKHGAAQDGVTTTSTLVLMFQGRLLPISLISLAWVTAYMFCNYGVLVFVPTLMQRSLAVPPDVLRSISVIGAVVGGVSFIVMGFVNDALGRRFGALLPALAWAAMSVILYTFGHEKFAGSMLGFPAFWLYMVFMIGATAAGVIGPWMSELFPIEVRSTAVSLIYQTARGLGGGLGPVIVSMVAGALEGDLAKAMLITAPVLAVFFIMTILLPETRGRLARNSVDFPEATRAGAAGIAAPAPDSH